jgi:hypothetical protein
MQRAQKPGNGCSRAWNLSYRAAQPETERDREDRVELALDEPEDAHLDSGAQRVVEPLQAEKVEVLLSSSPKPACGLYSSTFVGGCRPTENISLVTAKEV